MIDGGVCRFRTHVTATSDMMGNITLHIETNCPNMPRMISRLGDINAYEEIAGGYAKSKVFAAAAELPHVTCPVPTGILKAIEAAGGLGLKRDPSIHFIEPGESVDLGSSRRCIQHRCDGQNPFQPSLQILRVWRKMLIRRELRPERFRRMRRRLPTRPPAHGRSTWTLQGISLWRSSAICAEWSMRSI